MGACAQTQKNARVRFRGMERPDLSVGPGGAWLALRTNMGVVSERSREIERKNRKRESLHIRAASLLLELTPPDSVCTVST